ncbi:unnamed protein product [Kuraishia capsulata CBS 1993]|uniref:Uncharacterized protein n=1 Tax=Kuraishia capsulata CBS 1993 TaxID=1382522 RepID=W6MHJ6_9ASCO|nr:uncharacterized protein KUCA_T00001714001 [Kuraishia capsulata CBS 1993]CDK25744.1 unnamed protein product [Kuraishia capsulata CBS 1993]
MSEPKSPSHDEVIPTPGSDVVHSPGTSPFRSRDRRASRSYSINRRPSFDTTMLNRGSRNAESASDAGSTKNRYDLSEEGEQDALGLLHGDVHLEPARYDEDVVIDHRPRKQSFVDNPAVPARHSMSHARRYSVENNVAQKSIPKTSSPLTSSNFDRIYMPPESPSQTVRPTYAERWVKRQSTYDKDHFPLQKGGNNYGSTSAAPIDIRERTHHNDTYHDAQFIGDTSSSQVDHYESSNPSSRRTSESSSLADVCFPLEALDDPGKQKSWPDIAILQEFADDEATELRKLVEANMESFQSRKSSFSSVSPNNSGINFQQPLVGNIDMESLHTSNLLTGSKIDESGPINGRLRPPKTVPWAKAQQNPVFPLPQTLKIPSDKPSPSKAQIGQYRFTYFREDLESTIHSTTISGLLQDDLTFSDLFVPSHYSVSKSNSVAGNSTLLNQPATSLNPMTKVSSGSVRPPTPAQTGTSTPTPSIMNEPRQECSPFWLDVLDPTEEEMKVLSKAFNIHPLTTEDIFLGETREKVELFKDYYLVCFRSFDVVHERNVLSRMAAKKSVTGGSSDCENELSYKPSMLNSFFNMLRGKSGYVSLDEEVRSVKSFKKGSSGSVGSRKKNKQLDAEKRNGRHRHKARDGELEPLNMYIIVFRDGVLTFHFAPTPHPINVRRRARLLRDYLTVTSDWIGYALIDDITDAFAPMIESIEDEVNSIEDAILVMHSADKEESDDDSDEDSDDEDEKPWFRMKNRTSDGDSVVSRRSKKSSTSTSSSSSTKTRVAGWKRKGDMLRRIGECRKRVMSILRLLGSKADVIKGFAKRCNEQWDVAPRSEIGMYLGDIQDHIVTMVQSLNHYERLLARSHSNYLAQINIDMTRVNNDMNDVLGKITILGTIVLPMNIVTGLWGMNVLVPGQEEDNLVWFVSITSGMIFIAMCCYLYAKRVSGLT